MVALIYHEVSCSCDIQIVTCYFVSLFKGKALCFGETNIAILTVIFRFMPNHWDGKWHRRRLFI